MELVEKAQREGKENNCEVIVAKHRNGPVGTVELYFERDVSELSVETAEESR